MHNPCWYTYSASWMQNGSLQWVLSKEYLHTRSRYCIITLSESIVHYHSVDWKRCCCPFLGGGSNCFVQTSSMCIINVWHWLGCVFSLFVWLFWTLWSCFVECRCFVFFTNIRLENMFPPDYFCFGADAAQGVFTDSSRTSCWWVFREIVNVSIKTAICTSRVCIVSESIWLFSD